AGKYLLKRSDNTTMPVEVVLSHFVVGGQPKVLFAAVDISAREQVDRMRREFVAVVSHDIQTPLTAVTGTLGLLKNGVLGKVSDKALDYIGRSLGDMSRL